MPLPRCIPPPWGCALLHSSSPLQGYQYDTLSNAVKSPGNSARIADLDIHLTVYDELFGPLTRYRRFRKLVNILSQILLDGSAS